MNAQQRDEIRQIVAQEIQDILRAEMATWRAQNAMQSQGGQPQQQGGQSGAGSQTMQMQQNVPSGAAGAPQGGVAHGGAPQQDPWSAGAPRGGDATGSGSGRRYRTIRPRRIGGSGAAQPAQQGGQQTGSAPSGAGKSQGAVGGMIGPTQPVGGGGPTQAMGQSSGQTPAKGQAMGGAMQGQAVSQRPMPNNMEREYAVHIAHTLAQAQFELSQELELNLQRLKEIVSEAQSIGRKIESILGKHEGKGSE